MTSSVLISIIIPAYNTEAYIHRAVESSLRQIYSNIEIIIVDDGSTDDTLKTALKYSDSDERVRVFHQDNKGVSAARNYGIREAKGEYIMFLDSDDWLEDDAAEVLIDAQMKYPDKLICADFCRVKEDGTRTTANTKISHPLFLSIKDIALSYCGLGNLPGGFHSSCAKIFSSNILISNDIEFPEGIAYSEDAVFFVKYMYKTSGVYFLNKPVYNLFERSDSATRRRYTPLMIKSQIDAYDMLINLPEHTPEIRKLMRISRIKYTHIPL